ncbi:hypothetical protein HQ529_05375 [Candidatus Woesearchaeota archaeon]|nr:hypothetical protein [Candidatus Woesearchaeota archaeon]
MILKFEELDKLFEELDKALTEKVHFYVIGGAVMLYHGLKIGTKDVDLVIDSSKEFTAVEKSLKKIGFTTKIPTLEYKKFDLNQIFVRGDYRIDLFQRTVCKGFMLSDKMKERAQQVKELNNLTVSLCSTTDIFMFKTFTEREGDIDDCMSLAEVEIDWNSMIEEIKQQIKTLGDQVWVTWVGERLDILEDKGLIIPFMDEINKLRNKYFDDIEKKIS